VSVRWISERSDSRIGELGDVIVKQHRPEADAVRDAGLRARHEFEVLNRLHAAMPEAYSVPRALSLAEDEGLLTIERATGTPLDVLIRELKRERGAVARLSEPVRRAGVWLRTMQDATRGGPPSVTRQVEQAIDDAQAVFDGRTRSRVVDRLRELASQAGSEVTGHHGDYWPGNIFVDAGRVQVIDFEGFRDGHPLEDVAYFLLQLRLLMPRHPGHLPALREAFLSGYGTPEAPDALKLFTMTKTLRLMARNAEAKHSFLLRVWMRRTLRNVVAGCLR
jgi:aminoglycoside phosphotransferase (APT) family kinase protein